MALTGAVIVTTPSTVALADVRKAIEMFRQVNVEVLGVVENMSFFACPHCQGRIDIFGHGEGAQIAEYTACPFSAKSKSTRDPHRRRHRQTRRRLRQGLPGGEKFVRRSPRRNRPPSRTRHNDPRPNRHH